MKLRKPFSHVIFDLDGVLLDTEPLYTEATQRIVEPYGKVFEWSIKGEMMGRSSLESARYLISALGLPISAEEFLALRKPLLEESFRAADEIRGAQAFVRALHAHRIPMALATSSERSLCALKIERHGWFSLFQTIVCGDDPNVERLKPAPDIFLVAARALGAAPEQCLVFEDSLAGVEAARAANMQVIALPDPHMDRSRFENADLVVDSYDELPLQDLGLCQTNG
ncbi:MAG TPA: HAD-IA family hydrolase [Polyangiaceae bacterium]|nr:HAD-IA family hydrolase [Polyangiaceae bacterium]